MLGFDIRVAKIVWTVFLVAFLLFVTYMISSTLLVVVFSIFFSYLVYPLIQLVERYRPARMPRTASIALVFVLVVLVAAIAGSIFGGQIQDQAVRLGQQIPALLDAKNVSDKIPLPDFMEPLRQRVLDFISSQVQSNADQAMPLARNFGVSVMHAASNLIYLILVPVLSFLLIKEAPSIREELLSWLGQANQRMWSGIIKDLDVLLSKYVRALLLLSIATLISYGVAFSVLGVPYSLLLASIAAVLEFIPFAGPLAAVAISLAVAAFSGYPHLLWLLGFIFAYRMFQDYVLNPILMSEGVEVSPLLVIIGLLAGDQLGGVAGIFLSVPVIAALKIIFARASTSRREKLLMQQREIIQE